MPKLLTKSKYLAGLECDAYLWRLVNDKESIPPPDADAQAKFDAGNEVGILATKLYPGGVDISELQFMDNIRETKKLIQERKIIFEAGLKFERLYGRADILVPVEDNQWDIIEVKSSTEVKDIYISDVAFQKLVYEKCGLSIRKCFVMHINNQYVRQGELSLKDFLTLVEVTHEVAEIADEVPSNIERMLSIIDLPECPPFSVDEIPKSEYGNVCIDEFMDSLPVGSVFELTRGKKKAIELWKNGVQLLKDIPFDYKLSEKQQIQRDCAISGKPFISKEGIKNFLDSLSYPIYHLDFETFQYAIPLFDNSKPYQQIPFQYSLHIEQEDGSVEHKEFLFDGSGDPRKAFADSLKSVLGSTGTILAYNMSFEVSRLREIANDFPEYAEWFKSVEGRFNDLIIPFRNFSYYDPRQAGSASIKKVLPVFSDLSYNGMAISNGSDAMLAYLHYFVQKRPYDNIDQLKIDVLKYCELDTWAMVVLIRALRKL